MVVPRIVVVGAGVVGAAVAMRLAERGAAVTVVEATRPGAGTSGGSFGWLNANEKLPRHYFELNLRGMREHRVLARRSAHWYHPVGNLEFADPDGADELVSRAERLRDWGYQVRLPDPEQAARLEPAVPMRSAAVAYFPDEGYVDGQLLVDALLDHARAAGAQLVVGEPVTDLVVSRDGVRGVRLRAGRIDADLVVLCAGWQTTELAARAGVTVPLVSPHQAGSRAVCLLAEIEPPDGQRLRRVVHAPGIVARPARHGRLLVEPDHIPAGLVFGEPPPPGPGEHLLAIARRLLPALDRSDLAARLCVRPMPTDRYPVVGWCPGLPHCYVTATHSGVTLAPYLSLLVAAELLDGQPAEELAPYRPDRFVDAA
ncbi:MAG TPA: FAD-dependent oxidoreductase [Mycobacteriales bacterium]